MAGASCSAWRRPPASCTEPSTAPRSPIATDTWAVDVSSARSSTSAHDLRQRVGALGPREPGRVDRHDALVVGIPRFEEHAQPLARERGADAVAPLDHRHRLAPDDVVEAEVVQLLEVVEAVHV